MSQQEGYRMVVRVTVTLPEDVLARLDAIARDEAVTRSDVVREAAGSYIADREGAIEASRRKGEVEDGVTWLKKTARRPTLERRLSGEVLRDLRGEAGDAGAPIQAG
jgi:predicted transcriptional regulator